MIGNGNKENIAKWASTSNERESTKRINTEAFSNVKKKLQEKNICKSINKEKKIIK